MKRLTPEETRFLDVFLHEATTAPFTGPATHVLHENGLEYGDISHLAWAYEQDVPRTSFTIGHAAEVAPSFPWPDRRTALQRDNEIQRIWELEQRRNEISVEPNSMGSNEAKLMSNPSSP